MDRVVINQLERAASADINNLQHMGARQLTDVLRFLGAARRYPAAVASGDVSQQPQTWFMGVTVEKSSATFYIVNAGMMSSISTPNLTLDPLEGNAPIGFLRTSVVRPMPVANAARTSGEFYLISARIVSVVTLNTVVEVFDVPSQTFVPTAKDKRIEYQLEFREDVGPQVPSIATQGAYPAFSVVPSGAGWEPVAFIKVYPNTANVEHGEVTDVRRDLRDLLRGAPLDPLLTADIAFAPEVRVRQLESTGSPSDPTWERAFRGQFRGSIRGNEYSIGIRYGEILPLTRVYDNELETHAAGNLNHYYLVPMRKGSTARVPSFSYLTVAAASPAANRGILVKCQLQCPPTREGRNSAAIRLPRSGGLGLFVDYDDVAVGEACYVCSAQSHGDAADVIPFAMTQGRLVYPLNATPGSGYSAPRVLDVALADGTNVWNVNLMNYVPRNARWVELGIRLAPGNTAVGAARCEVKIAKEDAKHGTPGTSSLTNDLVLDSISIGTGHPSTEWWGKMRVPLLSPTLDDAIAFSPGYFSLAIEFEYQTLSGSTFGSCQGQVFVTGWEI
ncbi:hypothetical protein UFOVP650_70 [uncultured Caudovirales phage]|uniref:Uncharacterized protein n=1 Tax=uncultured Caudovirales phage TaxID=2100421 RepID=A0A6J5NAG7_9CAUD|nr:hypothetical protein UFOVP650_70 [uncultured Caudovirales phage]